MLTEISYWYAIYCYVAGAFLLGFLLVYLSRSWLTSGWRVPFFLLFLSIFLTPAYPSDGVETMAPALIVAAFQFFTHGFEAAAHAFRPLALGAFFACVISLLYLAVKRFISSRFHR